MKWKRTVPLIEFHGSDSCKIIYVNHVKEGIYIYIYIYIYI